MGASTSYACETGICNTAILLPTAGANGGKSDLGCWATNFGSSAFTLIQDIGTAGKCFVSTAACMSSSTEKAIAVIPAATSAGSASAGSTGSALGSASSAASSASRSGSGTQSSAAGGSSAVAGAASTSSRGGAAAIENGLGAGGLIAAALAFVQALL